MRDVDASECACTAVPKVPPPPLHPPSSRGPAPMVSSPSETLAYRTPACPRVGLSLAPFLLLFFSFYSTLVSILVVAAVVIDDAGRHRAAGRVVIGKVAPPPSTTCDSTPWRFPLRIFAGTRPGLAALQLAIARTRPRSQRHLVAPPS